MMTDAENMNEIEVKSGRSEYTRAWLVLSLIFIVTLITLLSIVSDSWRDNRRISKVKVFGCNMSSAEEIEALVLDSVKNLQIMEINNNKIIKLIKKNNFISEVRTNPLFNGEYQIFITERFPIAVSIDSDGNPVFCDGFGETFPYIRDSNAFDFPVIRGLDGTERFTNTARFLNRVVSNFPEYSTIISEIMPGRGINTYEIITSDYGYRLIIDSKSAINDQLKKYYTFLGSGICANEKIKIDYIDLRWEKRLVIGKLS
jgi:cell division septal protein FtsQ